MALPADWLDRYPISELVAQAHYLSRKYDEPVLPAWNTQGIQNVATLLAGTDFFLAYHDEPDLAYHLLQSALSVIGASVDFMAGVGSLPNPFTHANCTTIMISPTHFQQWLLPYELSLYEHVSQFNSRYAIHHCGKLDAYLPVYRQVPEIVWFEVGTGSDVPLAQRTFPNTHFQLIVSATSMLNATAEEVAQHIHNLLATIPDLGRFSLSIPDLEYGPPDDNVSAAVEAVRTLQRANVPS